MKLLSNELRSRLPPIHSQEAETDPVVYAKFFLPGTDLAWYVIEGQPEGDDYLFFGFVTRPRPGFRTFRLSELRVKRSLFDQPVERDRAFREGRLTDFVPAPDA